MSELIHPENNDESTKQGFAALERLIAEYIDDNEGKSVAPHMRAYFCDGVVLPALYDEDISYDEACTLFDGIGVKVEVMSPEERQTLLETYPSGAPVQVFVAFPGHYGYVNHRIAESPHLTLLRDQDARRDDVAVVSALNMGTVVKVETAAEADWAPHRIQKQAAEDGSLSFRLAGIKLGHA